MRLQFTGHKLQKKNLMSTANRAMDDRMGQLSGVNVSQNHCELVLDGWTVGQLCISVSHGMRYVDHKTYQILLLMIDNYLKPH